jgi:hypothetical protein
MDSIVKRRYTEDSTGRHCLVTYRRADGSKYVVQAY